MYKLCISYDRVKILVAAAIAAVYIYIMRKNPSEENRFLPQKVSRV